MQDQFGGVFVKYTIHPVILCGGSGTRLWPLSTPERPKQFLDLTSENSMIEETALRFETAHVGSLLFERVLVVGSQQHSRLLEQALPDSRKILEPFGRNSAPAVAAACLALNANSLILILPADHDIVDVVAFHKALAAAANSALDGAIVTFGIQPTHAATGYGYIKAKTTGDETILPVESFVEKPDLKTAESYLAEGSYFWNAGIFMFTAKTMLDALGKFAPDVLNGAEKSMRGQEKQSVIKLNPREFAATPSISIDYAVMEKAESVKTVPVSMGWSDVGGYRALHDLLTEGPTENHTSGPVIVDNSQGNYVRSEGPVVAVSGVSDLVIVATEKEVMITPMHDDVAVKTMGAKTQSNRSALGLSLEVRNRAQDWLWTTLEHWSIVGCDPERGGFVEQLAMDGSPDAHAPRRVRVQARQVFSFSRAISLGWPGTKQAEKIVNDGLHYIDTRLRHPEGGFVHIVDCNGAVIDPRRDLYDHAFMILAGSAANRALGSEIGLKIAQDSLAYINRHLRDHRFGGWYESSEFEQHRRANPHMHMLEAVMELHLATGTEDLLDLAAESVRLFETKYFDPETDIMAEYFDDQWNLASAARETIFEPGHHFEWASLLHQYDQLSDHDSLSWRRRLIRQANNKRNQASTGFSLNAMYADGRIANGTTRLWPQLERFRAMLLHPGIRSMYQPEQHLSAIFESFLSAGPKGGWVDELSSDGSPISSAVPASMLYHLMTAFSPLISD